MRAPPPANESSLSQVLGRRLFDAFLDVKNELLRLKGERGGGPVSPAQAAWEELHVRMYLAQLEGLATTLRATSLARAGTGTQQGTSVYLQVRRRPPGTTELGWDGWLGFS